MERNPISESDKKSLGFELPRTWVLLNCVRTRHGRSDKVLSKWLLRSNPKYDCSAEDQMKDHHIVTKCLLTAFNEG